MLLRLRPGFSGITNDVLTIQPGQTIKVLDGYFYDKNVLEEIHVDKNTGLELFDTNNDKKPEEKVEEVHVEGEIIGFGPKKEEVEEVEEEVDVKLTIGELVKVKGIGRATARKFLAVAKTKNDFFRLEKELRRRFRDDYVDSIKKYLEE